MMRVLTVRQPWAWAIVHGYKAVENRTRNVAGDYRGPVAIHAGLQEDTSAREHPEILRYAREYGQRLAYGHILGVVNLWAVHQHDGSERFLCCPNAPDRYTRWAQPDAWHLCMASARRLAEPIPYKGALGLRTLSADVEAQIRAGLA